MERLVLCTQILYTTNLQNPSLHNRVIKAMDPAVATQLDAAHLKLRAEVDPKHRLELFDVAWARSALPPFEQYARNVFVEQERLALELAKLKSETNEAARANRSKQTLPNSLAAAAATSSSTPSENGRKRKEISYTESDDEEECKSGSDQENRLASKKTKRVNDMNTDVVTSAADGISTFNAPSLSIAQEQLASILLSQLDHLHAQRDFSPIDDANNMSGAARLTLFRWNKKPQTQTVTRIQTDSCRVIASPATSEAEFGWSLVLERILFSPEGGSITTDAQVIGPEGDVHTNQRDTEVASSSTAAAASATSSAQSGSSQLVLVSRHLTLDFLSPCMGKLGDLKLGDGVRVVHVRHVEVKVPAPDERMKWALQRGVELAQPPSMRAEEFMRSLVGDAAVRSNMFHTDDELRAALHMPDVEDPVSALSRLLRLDEWHHPSWLAPPEQRPSNLRTWQALTAVVVSGHTHHWTQPAQPLEEPNTHWSHWPDDG